MASSLGHKYLFEIMLKNSLKYSFFFLEIDAVH